jgi:hypothetical protein
VTLELVPVSFKDACDFIGDWHRHNKPPAGWKFGVGVADGTTLVGVATVGRPVSRAFDDGFTLEVNRTCTDGTSNANSMLYGACTRATFALGYRRLITYTQHDESGASLKAAGWKVVAERPARPSWNAPSRPRTSSYDSVQRTLWEATR